MFIVKHICPAPTASDIETLTTHPPRETLYLAHDVTLNAKVVQSNLSDRVTAPSGEVILTRENWVPLCLIGGWVSVYVDASPKAQLQLVMTYVLEPGPKDGKTPTDTLSGQGINVQGPELNFMEWTEAQLRASMRERHTSKFWHRAAERELERRISAANAATRLDRAEVEAHLSRPQ